MDKITIFINRLEKLNINLLLISNFPYVYLYKVNGKTVKEKSYSDHGFTIAFLPIREEQEIKFTNINEIFKLIRKYL